MLRIVITSTGLHRLALTPIVAQAVRLVHRAKGGMRIRQAAPEVLLLMGREVAKRPRTPRVAQVTLIRATLPARLSASGRWCGYPYAVLQQSLYW